MLLLQLSVPMVANAQQTYTFKGIVYDELTMQPVWGHSVWLTDEDSVYYDLGFTDIFGTYTLSIETDSTPGPITVSTFDCMGELHEYTFQIPDTLNSIDFVLCFQNTSCEAFYTYEPVSPSDLFSIQFTDLSYAASEWLWDFGDGTADTTQHPLHNFNTSGTYFVCLQIIDSLGMCSDTYCMEVMVGDIECEANFIAHHDSLPSNTIQFVDMSLGSIDVWYWTFGDGEDSYEQSPMHEYDSVGTYEVCLQIFGSNGLCADSVCQTVVVSLDTSYCEAGFELVLDTLNLTPHTYRFINQSEGELLTYLWDFGDGEISTLEQPEHTYANGGDYTVCLVVNSIDGCTDSLCQSIETMDYYNFGGQVFMGDFPMNIEAGDSSNMASAYLYRKINNSWKFMEERVFWEYGYYTFLNKPVGEYLVRVDLHEGALNYEDYAPTYFTHATDWKQAAIFDLNDSLQFATNVQFRPLADQPSGMGSISGYISGDFSCFNDTSFILSGQLVELYNNNNKVVQFTYTDTEGDFSFSGLSMGNYSVKVEYTGLYSPYVNLALTDSEPGVSGLEMMVHCQHPTNIEDSQNNAEIEIVELYPVPASDRLHLNIVSPDNSSASISLWNLRGQMVWAGQLELYHGAQTLTVDTRVLHSGVYVLKMLSTEFELIQTKKIIINQP